MFSRLHAGKLCGASRCVHPGVSEVVELKVEYARAIELAAYPDTTEAAFLRGEN